MALTSAEVLSCFEILDAFWADTASITNGYGTVLTLDDISTLKTNISTRLAALDVASLVKVSALVAEWDALGNAPVIMEQAGTGSTTGLNYNVETHKANIRKKLHTYVPVLHMVDAIMRREGPKDARSGVIPIMRG